MISCVSPGKKGVSNTLGGLALIICLGAILGKILETGGAAEKIARTLINGFGEKNIQWAIMLTGFFIGIPLYYNAGFVILVPLVFSIAYKAKLPLLYVAIPMAASLSTTHCFLPPHPSPVFLVNAFKADIGKTLIYGLIITIPVVIVAGPILGRCLKKTEVNIKSFLFSTEEKNIKELPAALPSFLVGLLPVILITTAVIANYFLPDQLLKKVLLFIGDPTIALLVSVFLAIGIFGWRRGNNMETITQWLNEAISGIAVILLIITAGGIFKQVLQADGECNDNQFHRVELDECVLFFCRNTQYGVKSRLGLFIPVPS